MACNCIREHEKRLLKNERVHAVFDCCRIEISVAGSIRFGNPYIVATFCPFCGTRYKESEPAAGGVGREGEPS